MLSGCQYFISPCIAAFANTRRYSRCTGSNRLCQRVYRTLLRFR